ncbi:MAG: pyridoxamine 5'-phosphate oxidase family protein [Deltaproteobacteria bacterium]|nr:MAG: pyridoxamine 5'-phosphate oxidase family protein [Deltaproteobacteria bacterium]
MGEKFPEISDKYQRFIKRQKIFFVGTAAPEGRVNVSPKGMETLRILDANRVVWLNFTGSGNETSAHVQESPRMTLMFAAFEGKPMILRLYGRAKVVHMRDPEWDDLFDLFRPFPGARQIFDLHVDLVQASCGMGVPLFTYAGEREMLREWAVKVGEEGVRRFWRKHNKISLDGKPTYVLEKNGVDE